MGIKSLKGWRRLIKAMKISPLSPEEIKRVTPESNRRITIDSVTNDDGEYEWVLKGGTPGKPSYGIDKEFVDAESYNDMRITLAYLKRQCDDYKNFIESGGLKGAHDLFIIQKYNI